MASGVQNLGILENSIKEKEQEK
jgi:hypothetical protein